MTEAANVAFTPRLIQQHRDTIWGGDEKLNLTEAWWANGSPKNKVLKDWKRLPQTVQFIETVAEKLKVGKSHLLHPAEKLGEKLKVRQEYLFETHSWQERGHLRPLADLPGLCQVPESYVPHVGKPGVDYNALSPRF